MTKTTTKASNFGKYPHGPATQSIHTYLRWTKSIISNEKHAVHVIITLLSKPSTSTAGYQSLPQCARRSVYNRQQYAPIVHPKKALITIIPSPPSLWSRLHRVHFLGRHHDMIMTAATSTTNKDATSC
mmetsp:Transcript_64329/g.76157  ORF Transcript_64329/g.76157 Transcript_64329/m.76157 type:complete len:128 (+) Transcript_64329:1570-1953(+)